MILAEVEPMEMFCGGADGELDCDSVRLKVEVEVEERSFSSTLWISVQWRGRL